MFPNKFRSFLFKAYRFIGIPLTGRLNHSPPRRQLSFCFTALSLVSCLTIQAQPVAPNLPGQPPYSIAQSGPNQRVWRRVVAHTNLTGNLSYRTNAYVEIATGMNHLVGNQWVESSDDIQLTTFGGAATNTQHQVNFLANINTPGCIDLVTPHGRHLTSTVLGMSLYDSASDKSAIIAQLQDSLGQILPAGNQVIYTNALGDSSSGFQADVLYTHKRNVFSQDVIVHQQLPAPASLGMNPDTTMIQVWTEFYNAADPVVFTNKIAIPIQQNGRLNRRSLTTETLNFGSMEMDQGSAYATGGPSNVVNGTVLVPVAKHWVRQGGQRFLVEEVPFNSVLLQLNSLPPATPSGNNSSSQQSFFKSPAKTDSKLAKSRSLLLARQDANTRPGLVLDYNLYNSSVTNFTFQSDTTYYVTNEVDLYQNTTIEGGTVIKFSQSIFSGGGKSSFNEISTACLAVATTNLVLQTSPYRPAIFTGKDDDSVGTQISGSTGSPGTNYYGHLALDLSALPPTTVANVRFSHLCDCLLGNSILLKNAQAVNCLCLFDGGYGCIAGWNDYSSSYGDALENVLLNQILIVKAIGPDGAEGDTLTAQNVTAHNCGTSLQDGTSMINFTNCLFVNFTNWQSYYKYTNHVLILTNDAGVFQTVGGGNHYLATSSPGRGGTITNIDPALLSDLRLKTTYPPMVYANQTLTSNLTLFPQVQRDTNSTPDLGYHYDPIDYAFGETTVNSGVGITVQPGTVIATFNTNSFDYGLYFAAGSQFICQGAANSLIEIVHFNTVQEALSNTWEPLDQYGSILGTDNGGSFPLINCQFTDFSVLTQDTGYFLIFGNSRGVPINMQDCQFHGGLITAIEMPLNFTNCLFERVETLVYEDKPNYFPVYFDNNLFWNGSVELDYIATNSFLHNNMFYKTAISASASSGVSDSIFDYNGYYQTGGIFLHTPNGTDQSLTVDPGYQAGALGKYYLPTNSVLVNAGSTTADQLGLYYYTTSTNQVPETDSPVDIGYHYVALGAGGIPLLPSGISIIIQSPLNGSLIQ